MINFSSFGDELVKIAGFELTLHGYPKQTAAKVRRIDKLEQQMASMKGQRHDSLKDEADELEDQVRYDDRIRTPFDQKAGPRLTTWEVLNAAGKAEKWDKMTDAERPWRGKMLGMKQLSQLRQDYQKGLQNPNRYVRPVGGLRNEQLKPGEVMPHEQAFLKQMDHLTKDPKVHFARLEYH